MRHGVPKRPRSDVPERWWYGQRDRDRRGLFQRPPQSPALKRAAAACRVQDPVTATHQGFAVAPKALSPTRGPRRSSPRRRHAPRGTAAPPPPGGSPAAHAFIADLTAGPRKGMAMTTMSPGPSTTSPPGNPTPPPPGPALGSGKRDTPCARMHLDSARGSSSGHTGLDALAPGHHQAGGEHDREADVSRHSRSNLASRTLRPGNNPLDLTRRWRGDDESACQPQSSPGATDGSRP